MKKVILGVSILAAACQSLPAASLDGPLVLRETLRVGLVLTLDMLCVAHAKGGNEDSLSVACFATAFEGLPGVFLLAGLGKRDPRATFFWRSVLAASDVGVAAVLAWEGMQLARSAGWATSGRSSFIDLVGSISLFTLAAGMIVGAMIDAIPYSFERPAAPAAP